jgi:hypothetical protein
VQLVAGGALGSDRAAALDQQRTQVLARLTAAAEQGEALAAEQARGGAASSRSFLARRRSRRLGRSTSKTGKPAATSTRASPAP